MFLAALVLQAATPQTAVDAERAFAAAAQEKGQWTAFREYAAADATMFVPQPVKAQDWLKDRKDPAKSVEWWPTESWVSCDGKLAVNIGSAKWPDGSASHFSTVWRRKADGKWRWLLDHGHSMEEAKPAPAASEVHKASCDTKPGPFPPVAVSLDPGPEPRTGEGISEDGTLRWRWAVFPNGVRLIRGSLWNGREWEDMLFDYFKPDAK